MANTRSHVVTIKFTQDEFEMMKTGAASARSTQSEYLRGCLLRDRLTALDPIAMKIARARLGGMFRGAEEHIDAWIEHMIEPAHDLKIHMEVESEKRGTKKK